MTGKRSKPREKAVASTRHDVVLPGTLSEDEGLVLTFSDEQIEFLEQRRRLANKVRPMERVGGSSLRGQCLEGLAAH